MEKIKYSIITPNYNSFHLMQQYFHSIEKQTYRDFEVIIIDDASTDQSYERLLQYQEKTDLAIRILRNKENSGPGVARNYGIREAKGEWITFVDNDDWIEENLLEKINNIIAKNNNLDCVIYDYYIDGNNKSLIGRSMYTENEGIIPVEHAVAYTRNHTVCKFYKTDILKESDTYFPNIRRHEDIAFVARAISNCKSIYYLKEPLYHYVQRKSSLSGNKQLDEKTLIEAFQILEHNISEKFPKEIIEKSVSDLLYGTCIIMCKAGKSKKEIKNFINSYEEKYPNWWNTKIISLIGRGKRIFLFAAKKRYIIFMKLIAKVHSIIIGG